MPEVIAANGSSVVKHQRKAKECLFLYYTEALQSTVITFLQNIYNNACYLEDNYVFVFQFNTIVYVFF